MRVYHYTTDINWRKICEGAKDFSYEVYPSYALDELFADAGQLENFKLKNNRYVDSQLVRGCWPSERFSYNAVC